MSDLENVIDSLQPESRKLLMRTLREHAAPNPLRDALWSLVTALGDATDVDGVSWTADLDRAYSQARALLGEDT